MNGMQLVAGWKVHCFCKRYFGEDEIYIQVPDGVSNPIRITSNGDVYKYDLAWSPDSKRFCG